ncbi:hypothetical protein TNCV_342851 [Trichonephila clavipes]|nr:hypothetical protein TNCV_342851 [Trichonephila clavipes]
MATYLIPSKGQLLNPAKVCSKTPKVANDGSSDETFSKGGSGVFMTTSSDSTYQRGTDAGVITSCFTCELWAIFETLDLYGTLLILEQAKDIAIFCDLKAALQAILNGDTELTPAHTFDCPTILAALEKIGAFFSATNLCGDNIEKIAITIIWAHESLKTRRVEGLMHTRSVKVQTSHVGVVWKFGVIDVPAQVYSHHLSIA